jgi:hypothetical protein
VGRNRSGRRSSTLALPENAADCLFSAFASTYQQMTAILGLGTYVAVAPTMRPLLVERIVSFRITAPTHCGRSRYAKRSVTDCAKRLGAEAAGDCWREQA